MSLPHRAILKTLHPGDGGSRNAQHLNRTAVAFDEITGTAPPPLGDASAAADQEHPALDHDWRGYA